jgi:hypothetical protein
MGVGPQGRPPCTSAGAYPAAALPRTVSRKAHGTAEMALFSRNRDNGKKPAGPILVVEGLDV